MNNQNWAFDLMEKAMRVSMEIEESKVLHFHPDRMPETLEEALQIYEAHGNRDYTVDALDVQFCDLVSDLIKGKRFIVMEFSPQDDEPIFHVKEFDEDFEVITNLFDADEMSDALDFAYEVNI